MRMLRLRCAVAILLAPLGCDGEPDPYDTSCKADGDCAIVPTGSCDGCDCQVTAINADEVTRYNEDRKEQCETENDFCGIDCADKSAVCSGNGRCAVE